MKQWAMARFTFERWKLIAWTLITLDMGVILGGWL